MDINITKDFTEEQKAKLIKSMENLAGIVRDDFNDDNKDKEE